MTLAGNGQRFLVVGMGYCYVIFGVENLEYGGIWLKLWLSRGQISRVDISEAILEYFATNLLLFLVVFLCCK